MRRGTKGLVTWGFAFALILAIASPVGHTQEPAMGSLAGFIFGPDGSTPVPGAIVVVRNLNTGIVIESKATDAKGLFTLPGLPAGLYALGVRSAQGSYNSQDFFGVTAQQTSRISIALNTYDAKAAAGAAEVIREQRAKGEAYVGKIVKCDLTVKEAEAFVEVGLIQADDRIHVKGQTTDFYLDLRGLKASGEKTERVTSGSTAAFKTAKSCEKGDFVYVVCKRGVPPFFLAPLGIAAIVAGAVPLAATYEDEPVSAFKIK